MGLMNLIRNWRIDRQFKNMGNDTQYQESSRQLQEEFAASDAEALRHLDERQT